MAKVGDYNMTSDRSGFVYPRSEMRQEWTGRWVHYSEWEPQHPQEIITPKKDNQRVWPVRDEQAVVMASENNDSPLVFSTYTNASISSSGYVCTSLTGVGYAVSDQITQDSTLRGVRVSFDTSQLVLGDTIYIGYADTNLIESATKNLQAALQYDGSNLNIINLGNTLGGDYIPITSTHTYNSGSQICIAIKYDGTVKAIIGGVEYSYTTSPACNGLKHFYCYYASGLTSGIECSISRAASIYPTVTDFMSSTVPYIPPSQLDSY